MNKITFLNIQMKLLDFCLEIFIPKGYMTHSCSLTDSSRNLFFVIYSIFGDGDLNFILSREGGSATFFSSIKFIY